MKKIVLTLMAMLVAISIFLFFNPNKLFEQVFKFGQDYEKVSAEDVRIYVSPQVSYNTDIATEQLKETREFAEKLFNQNFDSHPSLAIYVTEPGYRGHERLTNLTGAYLYEMGVILINGEEAQFASSTTVHEYTHFLLDLYVKEHGLTIEDIPDWLTEGLAEYVAFQVEQALPQKYSLYYDHFPFPQLHEMTNVNVDTVYLQGFYAVYDLAERFGVEVVPQLILAYKETNDFTSAFEQVTNLDYRTYHDEFFINRNELAKLSNLKASPEEVITIGEQLVGNRAAINPYTPFVYPDLVGAALALGNVTQAKLFMNQLEPLMFNPYDYLHFADAFRESGDVEMAQYLSEQARLFAEKYAYSMEEFERELKKVSETPE